MENDMVRDFIKIVFLICITQFFTEANMRKQLGSILNNTYVEPKKNLEAPVDMSLKFMEKMIDTSVEAAVKDVKTMGVRETTSKYAGVAVPDFVENLRKAKAKGDEILGIKATKHESSHNGAVEEISYKIDFKDGTSSIVSLKYYRPTFDGEFHLFNIETSEDDK